MKRNVLKILFVFHLVLLIVILSISMGPTKKLGDVQTVSSKKPVILLTIDSLMSQPLQEAMNDGRAPALAYLIKNGQYIPEVISSYPTMSVAIDSTILTGTYADQHKIPGLIWFKQQENRMISYGSGIREIWDNGVGNVARDSIIRLNNEHLNSEVKTIFEELAQARISSGSINGLIYRGDTIHQFVVPRMLSFTRLLPRNIEVSGPTILSLGVLSQYNPDSDFHKFIWSRMGVNDDFTVSELAYLIEQHKLPPFTFAYFPNHDAKVHQNGPAEVEHIKEIDQSIQELLNLFHSWEEAMEEVTWIVTGDSSQSFVGQNKEKSLIDLNDILKDYTFWNRKNPEGELAIAINGRMAYIHLNNETTNMDSIIESLRDDKRIGFIAWKDERNNYVTRPEAETILSFSKVGKYRDVYNQTWNLNGDVSLLDLSFSEEGLLQYDSYPDGLARLNGALNSHEGTFVIVDAKPSYEFIEAHSHDHAGGGAHGSLHKLDSSVPLIIAGTDTKPKSERLVDMKEWILGLVQ